MFTVLQWTEGSSECLAHSALKEETSLFIPSSKVILNHRWTLTLIWVVRFPKMHGPIRDWSQIMFIKHMLCSGAVMSAFDPKMMFCFPYNHSFFLCPLSFTSELTVRELQMEEQKLFHNKENLDHFHFVIYSHYIWIDAENEATQHGSSLTWMGRRWHGCCLQVPQHWNCNGLATH